MKGRCLVKRPTQKLIAFSTALVSVLGLIAPMTAAAEYEAELVESEYDELIEMRDKAILIKNGNDASVGDDTQLVIIDSKGKKQLISKEEGLSGIYNYVTKTREEYNFISPSNNPYSFNFFDENYRISTESGVIIAGYGDKFALADAEGKKLSDEYDAIYRISDDYFMVDLNDSTGGRKTGLIKADGSVITAPANGIGEFYLCGDKFLVSEYSTELAEETSDDGTKAQTENTVYKYHFMSKDGKPESETFTGFEELGHNYGDTPLYDNESHSGHYRTDLRYNVNYVFDADCICLTDNDNKKVIYNSKTESFSGRYIYVEAIDSEKFIVSHDNVKDIINSGFKAIIKDADNIYMDSHYRDQTVIKVKKDGKVTEYDKSLKAVTESDVIKRFPTFFNNAYVVPNGNTVTVNSDESDYLTDFNEEFIKVSVNVDVKHTVEGSTAQVTLSDDHSDFDFELIVNEEYVDEDGRTVSDYHTYKYVLDADYKPHDVTEYSGIYRNLDHNRIIFEKSDNTLEYVNFADASDKPDLSQYTSVSDFIQDGNYTENKTIGYCLKTEDTFVLSDMNFNTLHKPVNGTPSDVKIHCENGKYSGYVIFQDNETYQKYGVMTLEKGVIIPAEYDHISAGYKGFLATKDGKTDIIGEDGKSLKEFDGSYGFNSMTGCVYDANWNLVSRTDGVTSNIVYNISDGKIRYQQSGTYDEVSYFVDDYAVVRKNIDTASDDDDLWNSTDKSASGIININGTEVVKPDASLYITMDMAWDDNKTIIYVDAKSYTASKDSTEFTLTPEELKTGYINAHNMTFAKMTSADRYFALVDGLWGVYDGKGKEIVKPQFDYIEGFNENGMSILETPEYNTCYEYKNYTQEYEKTLVYKTGVIDNKGNILVKPFNNVTEDGMKFKDNEIDNYSIIPYVLKNVLLDKYGIQVCRLVDGKPKYMTITSDDVLNDFAKTNGYDIARKEGDLYYVEKDGLSGVVSKDNEVLVPIEYFEVLSFSPSEKNSIYVRPELYKILESEYTSKIKESSDGSKLVYVKTLDGKVGVYKITGSDSVIGDANGDGKVNVRDAAYIAKMLATGQGSKLPASADFNGDGKVNVRDAAAIAKYLAQKK